MRFCNLAPWAICAATLLSAPAFAEAQDARRMKPVKFKTESVKVEGISGCNGVYCASYSAEIFDDLVTGERQGKIRASLSNGSHFGQQISCSGVLYADMLKYDEKTLEFTLDVTVDPLKDPSCFSTSDSAIVINLSGGPNGTYRDSSTGKGTITTDTSKTRYKVEHDVFSGSATGTNGYFQGTYSADLDATRRTERTKAED